MSVSNKQYKYAAAAAVWSLKQILLIAIPLIIYTVFLGVVPETTSWDILSQKPEWMFIAVMYNIEDLRDSTEHYNNSDSIAHDLWSSSIAISYILLVISCIILFAVLAPDEHVFLGNKNLTIIQWINLGSALIWCWHTKYRIRYYYYRTKYGNAA